MNKNLQQILSAKRISKQQKSCLFFWQAPFINKYQFNLFNQFNYKVGKVNLLCLYSLDDNVLIHNLPHFSSHPECPYSDFLAQMFPPKFTTILIYISQK